MMIDEQTVSLSEFKAMRQELDELLDKQAIQELIYAYCNAADRRDYDKMRALYHADATDDHGGFFKGLAHEFIDQLPEIQKTMQILHHNITSFNIKLAGDQAEGELYVLAYHKVTTNEADQGAMDLMIGGRYFDKYEKRDGVWKYAHRAVVADWVLVNDESVVHLDAPIIEGSFIGKPDTSDPSYDFFELFKRGER